MTKTSKRWAWLTMLLLGVVAIGITSCNDDDNDNNTVTPDPGSDEAASGFIYSFLIESPESGRTFYLETGEEIPTTPDPSTAVELQGERLRFTAFEDDFYVADGEANTIVKWEVDRTTLELTEAGIMNVVGTGLEGGLNQPFVILSETQAFLTNLVEGTIIEWNPAEMTITREISVEAPPGAGGDEYLVGEWGKIVRNGKYFMPIWYFIPECCDFAAPFGGAAIVAVFDPSAGTLEYVTDDRLIANDIDFIEDENGTLYLGPTQINFTAGPYYGVDAEAEGAKPIFLRFRNDGTFDPDFIFDASDHVGEVPFANGPAFIADNKVHFVYLDSTFQVPDAFSDFNAAVFGQPENFRQVLIDLETGEVEPFTALNDFTDFFTIGTSEGQKYLNAGGDGEFAIIRQDGPATFTEVARGPHQYRYLARLW